MVATGLKVRGLRDLQRLLKAAGPDADRTLKRTLREVAEPIRADAEQLAVSRIPRVGLEWSRMRVGVTQRAVYVAPRARGTRGITPRSRPRFADLMEQRAMHPALEQNRPELEARVDAAFDEFADDWNARGLTFPRG